MGELWVDLAHAVGASSAHDWAVAALRTVPGLPPIVQTVHLLSIAVVLGSVVLVGMRTLRWAVPSQEPAEMARRLAPWTWAAVPMLFVSGCVFVLARPQRYFANPVFGAKLLLLAPALVLTALLYRSLRRAPEPSRSARWLAAFVLLTWIGVVFAGRWIAYVDYLLPME